MIFILLAFTAAFAIEALGTYVSIIGLSSLFGLNIVIMAIAIALDVGKLLVVSLLYTHWKKLGVLMKSYALIAAAVTMTITSAGAMGYLSGEFQKAIMGSQENTLKVDVLKAEQGKLEARKLQIDQQIAELPKNYSNARIKLMKEFSSEQSQITDRLTQLNKDLPELQIAQIGVEAKVGPIVYISKAFDVPVEVAVKWVILMIIFVFDPLAVFLIIAANFLLHLRRTHTDASMTSADLFAEEPSVPRHADAILPVLPIANHVFDEVPAADLPKPEQVEEPFADVRPEPYTGPMAKTLDETFVEPVYVTEPPSPPEPEGPMARTIDDSFIEPVYVPAPEDEGPMAKTVDETVVERAYVPAPEDLHEGPMAKTHDDELVAHEYIGSENPLPPVTEVPEAAPVQQEIPSAPVREVITRAQLQPPLHFSSLNAVKADDSIVFDTSPARGDQIAAEYYKKLT